MDEPAIPPAPWQTRLRAVVWAHRATPDAVSFVAPQLRGSSVVPVTIGAFVQYLDTPVGRYSEVFGSPVLLLRGQRLPAIHVPFMAVDLLASLRGGRENWALPKTLATFSGAGTSLSARSDDWEISAVASVRGPRLPLVSVARDLQVDGDGRELLTPMTARGVWRAARVDVTSSGSAVSPWLASGTHRGLVLERASMTFGVPR